MNNAARAPRKLATGKTVSLPEDPEPDVDFWTVPEFLAYVLPHQRADIEEYLLWHWDQNVRPYPHEFLELYLLPVLSAPPTSPNEELTLRRGVAALERLLTHPDDDVGSAALLSVIDFLDPATIARLIPICGPETRVYLSAKREGT